MSAVTPASTTAAREVEPAVAPPPGNPRFPLVDGLRAIAALSVLVYHAAYMSSATGAWYGHFVGRLEIGVSLFFVISGFLLYRPFFAAHYAGRPRIRTRDYLRRRVLRIVPAYWIALTALAIWPGLLGVFTGDWWIYYGFGQIYQQGTFVNGIPQAWSLCVEATFYLTLPVYALGMRAVCRGRALHQVMRIELGVLALLAVASIVFRTAAISGGATVIFTWLPGMFAWFAPGMALAVASVVLRERGGEWRPAEYVGRHPGVVWLVAGAFFVVLALTVQPPLTTGTIYTTGEYFRTYVLSAIVASLLIVPAVIGAERSGRVRQLLSLPALAWLGLISYGIFLWHHTVMTWLYGKGAAEWIPSAGFAVLTLLTFGATVICAAGSYYLAERPILRFKDPRRGRAD